MEIKICERVNGKGVYSTSYYKKGDIVHILNGEIKHIPSKYTIEISKDTHILDDLGKYINHSFSPNVKVSNTNIIAISDIKLGEEICYNYNESESVMANPFYCDGQFVSGKNDISIKKRFKVKKNNNDTTINNIEALISLMN